MRCDSFTIKAHIDAFFELVYPIPAYSFLHRAILMRQFSKGECSIPLLKVVCASASIFLVRSEEDEARRTQWAVDAEQFVLSRIDDPSLVNLQIMVLLTLSCTYSRNIKKGMSLLAMASRMAYMTRMNYEVANIPFMLAETRRRVMWGIWMIDSIYSGGLPEFTTCSAVTVHIRLPCKELNYEMDIEIVSENLYADPGSVPSEQGIMGYFIRILDIRDRILRYVELSVSRSPSRIFCIKRLYKDGVV